MQLHVHIQTNLITDVTPEGVLRLANFLKTCSWGTKPSQFFSYAFLLNDVSARFFQMFGKRRENSILRHFWRQGGTPRHPESAQGTPESTAWIFHRFLKVPGPLFDTIWRHIGLPMATCGDAWAHRWAPRDTKKRVRDRTRLRTRSTERLWTVPGWLYVMKT